MPEDKNTGNMTEMKKEKSLWTKMDQTAVSRKKVQS